MEYGNHYAHITEQTIHVVLIDHRYPCKGMKGGGYGGGVLLVLVHNNVIYVQVGLYGTDRRVILIMIARRLDLYDTHISPHLWHQH